MKVFRKIVSGFALIVFSILLLNGCGNKDTELVARVGGRKITRAEFESQFAKGKKTKQIQTASLKEKRTFLDNMINDKLKVIDAYQHNLQKTDDVVKVMRRQARDIMFRRLIDKEVVEKIIPESRMKDYYNKTSREVNIKQIVLRPDKDSPEKKEEALKKARKIVQRIKDGEKFETLAKEMSEDYDTARRGGKKGYLKWGPTASKSPIYVAAFSMREGEVSDPIETSDGIYIIKVVHIKKYPAPPYEQEKEKIKKTIFRILGREIESKYYEYLDGLRKKFKMKFNKPGVELFVKKYNSTEGNTSSSLEQFSGEDRKTVLTSFTFSNITIGDLIKELEKFRAHRRPPFKKAEDVENFINKNMVPLVVLGEEVKKKKIKNDPIVKKQLKDFEEKVMINSIYRLQVKDKIKINEEDIKKYFEEHREDYKHPPMREVQEIYVSDKKLADKIVRLARKGRNFTALFNQYNEKKSLDINKGKHGFISEGRAAIGRPAFRVKIGGVTEPIRIGKGYSIVKVFREKPATLKTYEEAKRFVSSKYRRVVIAEREKEWLDELRSKIDIVVYENNLDKACKDYIGSDIIMID